MDEEEGINGLIDGAWGRKGEGGGDRRRQWDGKRELWLVSISWGFHRHWWLRGWGSIFINMPDSPNKTLASYSFGSKVHIENNQAPGYYMEPTGANPRSLWTDNLPFSSHLCSGLSPKHWSLTKHFLSAETNSKWWRLYFGRLIPWLWNVEWFLRRGCGLQTMTSHNDSP